MWFPSKRNLPSSPSFVLMSKVSIPNLQSDLLKIFQQLCMSTWWPRMATSHASILSNTLGCQFSSVAQSHSTLCNPMDCSIPGFPVHHQLPEHAQTHVHPSSRWCHPTSHPLPSPSPPAFNLPQHQGLFQWVSFSHHLAKVLELQLQHQYFQWIFRTDFL